MMFSSRHLVVVFTLMVGIAIGWTTSNLTAAQKSEPMVYELRTYTTLEGRLPALNARFRNHTTKLFEKYGMKNVIYCTPVDAEGKLSENKLVYLLAHESQAAAKASFAAFAKDPEWVAAKEASEKEGKIVSSVESQFLVPTDYSPLK